VRAPGGSGMCALNSSEGWNACASKNGRNKTRQMSDATVSMLTCGR
jgi:hypothetical protein